MNPGHTLIITGVALIVIGLFMSGHLGPLGRLPGDILIERENTTIYIPVTTLLLLGLAATAILWLVNWRS